MSLLHAKPPDFDAAFAEIAQAVSQLLADPSRRMPRERWVRLHELVFKVCSNPARPRPAELYRGLEELR